MLGRIKKVFVTQERRLNTKFKKDLSEYKRLYNAAHSKALEYKLYPQLHDNTASTEFDTHYTYQGPWVMRQLVKGQPRKHIDVGSWTPYIGFFAALQPTVFIDIRPAVFDIPDVTSMEGSVLQLPFRSRSVESLSCLHVIEHIGLGRYGDPLDIDGTEKAIKELMRVIKPGGSLYVSLPVGKEMTFFNAHRVTAPARVQKLFHELVLVDFSFIDDRGRFHENKKSSQASRQEYACGMYHFQRPTEG